MFIFLKKIIEKNALKEYFSLKKNGLAGLKY